MKCVVRAVDGQHELTVVAQSDDAAVGDADVLSRDDEPERRLLIHTQRSFRARNRTPLRPMSIISTVTGTVRQAT